MKKRTIIIVATLAVIAAAIPISIRIVNDSSERKRLELELELEEAFYDQNLVFGALVVGQNRGNPVKEYMPIDLLHPHIDGIAIIVYKHLEIFRIKTGNSITYEQVIDYLSQEFEDDGSVRIFTNGRHPEIESYVRWARRSSTVRSEYLIQLREIYIAYARENAPFPNPVSLALLPIDMTDELIRKAADPDYEMDLTSIQNRYIAEGRAVVSEDGKSIEFLVPES